VTKSLVSGGFLFHEPVNAAVVVQPVKAPFHLPSLTAVFLLPDFPLGDILAVVDPPRKYRLYSPFPQLPSEIIAVVTLVRSQSFRPTGSSSNGYPIYRFEG